MPNSSLHVCNIANMAYGYAKMLNASGGAARVLCHDIKHVMSQPEWDDLELDPADFPDENNFFDNKSIHLRGYSRPDWFAQGAVSAAERIVIALNGGSPRTNWWTKVVSGACNLGAEASSHLPSPLKAKLKHFLQVNRYSAATAEATTHQHRIASEQAIHKNIEKVHSLLCRDATIQIEQIEVSSYAPYARFLDQYVKPQDVLFSYASAPISAMLLGKNPYVAVELGTIRDLPFEPNLWGQMIRVGFQFANHVIITNPDNMSAASRLGLKRHTFCPHPVNENVFRPVEGESALRRELLLKYKADALFLAPARQNWSLKGNNIMIEGFAKAVGKGLNAHLLIPSWGPDISKGQALARSLGVADRIHWLAPMSERGLVKYYQAVDAVLDQFILGVFGLITPKAMSCGRPVLCAYDDAINSWCFPVRPPLLASRNADEIADHLLQFVRNPEAMKQLGEAARQWILAHHSTSSCVAAMNSAAEAAKEHFFRNSNTITARAAAST